MAAMSNTEPPRAAPHRPWRRHAAIALAILLICPVALWLLIGWGAFAPEPIEPDMRLFLAKAAQLEVNVYECGEIPGTHEEAPPEDLSKPLRHITPDDVVHARVLPTPDQAGNSWAELLYGDCVSLDDLVPAAADDRDVPEAPGGGRLRYLPHGTDPYSENAEAWYGTRDEPAIFLYLWGRCAFYRLRPDGQVQWLIARVLTHEVGFRTGVYVWPREGDIDGVPDVLLYQPPLGLACFRWDGKSFRPRFPTLGQFGELVYLVVRGAPGWAALGWLALAMCWFVWASLRTELVVQADPCSADDQIRRAGCQLVVIVALIAAVLAFCLLWAIMLEEPHHDPGFHVP